MESQNCLQCARVALPTCVDSITIGLGFTVGTNVRWKLEGNRKTWRGLSVTDATGKNKIEHAEFSKALFIPAEGVFVLSVEATTVSEPQYPICDPVAVTVCGVDYTCVAITFEA